MDFCLKKAADFVNLCIEVDACAVAFPEKNPPVEAIVGMVVLLSN
jgi:hypothetical protein